jgi:hypothetical protein
VERVSVPSEVALPLPVTRRCAPSVVVGSGTVCTGLPSGRNSSRKSGAAAPLSAPVPSPTRRTTRFPSVNAAADAGDAAVRATMPADAAKVASTVGMTGRRRCMGVNVVTRPP